jgi:hypothetical protein
MKLMRWFLLIFSVSVSFDAAYADWKLLTVNKDRTVNIWIEADSISRRGDYVFAWVIYDREEPAVDGAMSSKAMNQYDCEEKRSRTWQQSFYSKSMASGTPLPPKNLNQCEVGNSLEIKLDDECRKPWLLIYEQTTGADILQALCIGKGI